MAESTLAAAFNDLQGDIGRFLGYGRGANNGDTTWDTDQQAMVDRCTKGGLRNFYFCGYDWTFLKPIASLTLSSAAKTVDLPDDFGGAEGVVHVSVSGQSGGATPIKIWGIGHVYNKETLYPTTTGRPQLVCIDPVKGTTASEGQRFQLRFWPIADQAYTIKIQYYVLPDYLTGALPYAYGGAQHSETLLESCLAVAEKLADDRTEIHSMEFEKRLAVSMEIDRRNKPQLLGMNLDRSDMRETAIGRNVIRGWSDIQYNGVDLQ